MFDNLIGIKIFIVDVQSNLVNCIPDNCIIHFIA